MLQAGGDCDGAAALVVASLRACDHPARAVVGYRLIEAATESARLVPHAVAELYRKPGSAEDAGVWWRIDATVPALGDLDDVFLPVAEGLGGALSMGRVLGILEPGDVVITGTPAGVAVAAPEPRPYLRDGDLVEIDGGVLGRHRSPVHARSDAGGRPTGPLVPQVPEN